MEIEKDNEFTPNIQNHIIAHAAGELINFHDSLETESYLNHVAAKIIKEKYKNGFKNECLVIF